MKRHAAHVLIRTAQPLRRIHGKLKLIARPQPVLERVVRDHLAVDQTRGMRIGRLGDAHVVNPQRSLLPRFGRRHEREHQERALIGEQVESLAHRERELLPLAPRIERERSRRWRINEGLDAPVSGPAKRRLAWLLCPRPK